MIHVPRLLRHVSDGAPSPNVVAFFKVTRKKNPDVHPAAFRVVLGPIKIGAHPRFCAETCPYPPTDASAFGIEWDFMYHQFDFVNAVRAKMMLLIQQRHTGGPQVMTEVLRQ